MASAAPVPESQESAFSFGIPGSGNIAHGSQDSVLADEAARALDLNRSDHQDVQPNSQDSPMEGNS